MGWVVRYFFIEMETEASYYLSQGDAINSELHAVIYFLVSVLYIALNVLNISQ